ncbi:MAG: sorbosone dehydrogenase family protein [Flavobacteriales bacterium]
MRMITAQILLAAIMQLLFISCHNGGQEKGEKEQLNEQGNIRVPEGFQSHVLAPSLGSARDVVVRGNGDIYVLLRKSRKGHCMVALRDKDGKGKADSLVYFGKHCGRGSLVIRNGYLYHSTDSSVLRTRFGSKDELVPSGPTQKIVGGFRNHGQHGNKNFDIDQRGMLYVAVGVPSNACQKESRTPGSPGMDPCPLLKEHAGIWKLDADKQGQHYLEDGVHFSTGIRNMVAIDHNEQTGDLYGVQHGRDQLHQLFPDRYSKKESAILPAEEMLLIEKGTDFGWPYCYYDGKQDKKVLAPEYGGDGKKVGRCAEKDDPIAHFPAHFAPNNLEFYHGEQFPEKYRGGAFIAFHGSWNRNEFDQWGYNVTFQPFKGKYPDGEHRTFVDGFEGPERVSSPSQAEYRPCGLAEGPEGSLYIVDSQKGRLWRIDHTG